MTPTARRDIRRHLLCPTCKQQTRTQIYISDSDGQLVTTLEGCTACRTGIYHDGEREGQAS